ncbi:MAG: TRAP transporter large permease subunit [Treponema sp.]|jgi:tripartite ATP-independent transporter DctM subunit|nr:TRAP transporter large permease subunit [Treponema sp.]
MGKIEKTLRTENPENRMFRLLCLVEETICYFSLVCLALFPSLGALARLYYTNVANGPALLVDIAAIFSEMGATDILTHLLLVAGLFAGMLTTKNKNHLAISIIQNFTEEKIRQPIAVWSGLLSSFISTIIAWCAISFIKIWLDGRLVGFIPDVVFASAIPLGYGVMAIRFALQMPISGKARILSFSAIIAGSLASFPLIAKIIWGFDTSDAVYAITDTFTAIASFIKIPTIVILLVSALAGVPLFAAIGGLALILLAAAGGELDVTANQIYATLTSDSFIAIPLFTLTGFFLSESKAGTRLVATFKALFSWLPGGMIIATVVICAFFTTFTGASGVTILALGGILLTILNDVKYKEKFSIGLLTSVGSIGLLFPPSIPIILVGVATQTNILHVFLGGIIPGLILVITVVVFGIFASIKTKIPVEKFSLKKTAAALRNAVFEILLPFILIIGYFSGVLSLVEIGAVAVLYVFIVEVLIHRDIALKNTVKVIRKAVPIIGGILSILALSQSLSYYIVDTQAPENFAHWMQSAVHSKYLFLLLLNLALLVVGCLMDIFSAILIVLPLITPLGAAYGIDPVHLGIIFITNLELGFLTPPVGMNLFLASYRFEKPFTIICRYVLPFLLIQLAVVLLVTYAPWLSTFLPRLISGS